MNMYQEKFVAVVKCNGKIMRERDGVISLPFGSEYSILLKNLNTVKASVDISVDSMDVVDGHSILIEPEKSVELEGFMRGSVARNRFKFINKTKEISEYRGDRIDDGLIRVEVTFEKKIEKTITISDGTYYTYYPPVYNHFTWTDGGSGSTGGLLSEMDFSISNTCSTKLGSGHVSCSAAQSDMSEPLSDEGITVKGSSCNQAFAPASIGMLEDNSSVIILQLSGYNAEGIKVKSPITVNTKITCETCGKGSKSNLKFCGNCGTSLI